MKKIRMVIKQEVIRLWIIIISISHTYQHFRSDSLNVRRDPWSPLPDTITRLSANANETCTAL